MVKKKMSFILYLFIFEEVLEIINILSKKIQKEGTIGNAVIEISTVMKTIKNMENEKSFDVLWNNVIQFLLKYNVDVYIIYLDLVSKKGNQI